LTELAAKTNDMTKEISHYVSEFESIYNGEPWYGKSLTAIINTAKAENVFEKPKPGGHSAYEITHHLYAWRALLVKRLNGDSKASIAANSGDDWAPLPKEQTAATWKALVKKLEKNQEELIKGLSRWKDDSFDRNFAGTDYTLRTHLNGQIQHDIYHIGQIALAIKNA
jgi:uncharacterized damage-inducible protein DinB